MDPYINFVAGFMFCFILHLMNQHAYKRILVHKADAPKHGQSNREFILGKPYVILHEADYIKECKVWYKK